MPPNSMVDPVDVSSDAEVRRAKETATNDRAMIEKDMLQEYKLRLGDIRISRATENMGKLVFLYAKVKHLNQSKKYSGYTLE